MTLAKSSLEIARGYLPLVPEEAEPKRMFDAIAAEHERTVASVLEIVEAKALLDRHPVVQRSIELRNPYVDPMNAIQVDLLRRYRARRRDADACGGRCSARSRESQRRCVTPAEATERTVRNRFRRIVHCSYLTLFVTRSYRRRKRFRKERTKITNIREVAKQSGVSVSTVSRVFNEYDDVSAADPRACARGRPQARLRTQAAARTLVKQHSQLIGVVLFTGYERPDIHHPFFQEVLVGLKHGIGEHRLRPPPVCHRAARLEPGPPHSYIRRAASTGSTASSSWASTGTTPRSRSSCARRSP